MKLIAFNRGKAISADPIWMGTNRFVKPPKSAGIIRKKIIEKAWVVTSPVRSWQSNSKADAWHAEQRRLVTRPAPICSLRQSRRRFE